MNYVKAKFHPYLTKDKEYTYATELDLAVGDHCVVKQTARRFEVLKISEINVEKPTTFKCKVLEQKVDANLRHNYTV